MQSGNLSRARARSTTQAARPTYGGGTVINQNPQVTVSQGDIHTQGPLTDTDKRALAYDLGTAIREGVDLVYMAQGATV